MKPFTHPEYLVPGMLVLLWLVVNSHREIGVGWRADFDRWYTVFTRDGLVHFDTLFIDAHLVWGADD
jgi:hypothetical protein